MRRILGVPLLLITCTSHAQMLLIEPGSDDPAALRFNPAFIFRNHVTAINGEANLKRDGEPIRSKNERTRFEFDGFGRTVFSNSTFGKPGSGHDTATVTFTYDAKGRVTEQLRNDPNGWFALRDELDTLGRATRQSYVRIDNLGIDRYQFVRGTETTISDERFLYAAINDTAWSRTWINDRALPYREQIFHKDRWGYLRGIDDRNLITSHSGRITFRYDEKGHLAERIEQADLSTSASQKRVWRYDAAGNVTLCDAWRDDRHTKHTEYLYEEGTMLLKAVLTKDMDTGLIHIGRYTTERR